MTDRIDATAAPTIIRVGGKEWRLSPLTDEDIAILDQWVKARHVKMARATLEKDAGAAQRELTERVALSQASTMTFMSGHGAAMISTIEGWAEIMWCSARRFHPEATPEDFGAMLNNPAALEDLRVAFDTLNQRKKADGETASKKKKVRRKMAEASRRANRA